MPTFIQIFDNAGEAQLSGGSNFKGHIDWIELTGSPTAVAAQPAVEVAPHRFRPFNSTSVRTIRSCR